MEWNRLDLVILIFLLVLGGSLRFVRLGVPSEIVFDETYYAKDACLYAGHPPHRCNLQQATEQSYVHPPLGKWLIAIGIEASGYNSFGWRSSAAVVGTALVGLVFLLGRRLLRDRWAGAIAGFLAATDFLLIVQSRIAMLDIFLAFFVTLGFLFLAYDRERVLDRRDAIQDGRLPEDKPDLSMRLAAGAALGLALSVKWSAAWALAGASIVVAVWSLRLGALAKPLGAQPKKAVRELIVSAVAFTLVPAAVYVASYSLYLYERTSEDCSFTVPESAGLQFGREAGVCVDGPAGVAMSFVDLHYRTAKYHLTLDATHKYQSKAWTWPFVKRPVAYYYAGKPKSSHILAFGNPFVWWASLAVLPFLLVRAARRWRPERLVLLGWGSQYLPWLIVSRPLFFFYMTPAVPFMVIGLAAGLSAIRDTGKVGRRLVALYLVLGVGLALYFFYPVIAAVGLPYPWWHNRMWLPSWI